MSHTMDRLTHLRALQALDDEFRAGATVVNDAYVEARGELLARLAAFVHPWTAEERNVLQALVSQDAASWQRMSAQKTALAQRLQSLQQRRRELTAPDPGWSVRVRRTC